MDGQTIAGIATMVGHSGINILRISGPDALQILNGLFRAKGIEKIEKEQDHIMLYGHLMEGKTKLDEAMAVYMMGPRSYTAEDVAEIHLHGGMMSIKTALMLCYQLGAVPAERGAFTKRAFLNGRLDLSQAEAIMGIIGARTKKALRVSVNQLSGGLSEIIKNAQEKIKYLLASISVYIDYPEEELSVHRDRIHKEIQDTLTDLNRLYLQGEAGKIYMEGLQVAFLGRTNVGKSSLMNALLREEKAIVTDIPGTTRDVVEAYLHIGDVPIKLIDTAGVRESEDKVEKIGIQKALEKVAQAQLVIVVLDYSAALTQEDRNLIAQVKDKKHLVVLNKNDLNKNIAKDVLEELSKEHQVVETSTLSSDGIYALEKAISDLFLEDIEGEEEVLLYQERHLGILSRAISQMTAAKEGLENEVPLDCIEVDIYDAYDTLGEITGSSVREDIIDLIFSEFCVGK